MAMKYTFKTKPYPHQRKALKFLLRNGGGGLQVPMRWGKTKVAVDFANCLHLKHGITRVLVVCPLSVVGVWRSEIEKHTPDGIDLEWRVMNFEQVYERKSIGDRSWVPAPRHDLDTFVTGGLMIVDESHHIGNPTTLVSKHCFRLGRRAAFRLIMSGTMFHRKPFFVFGQAKFYDPSVFGTAWTPFKRTIAVFGGRSGYEVMRYVNLRWMMKKVRPWVYVEKYVPPRPPAVNELTFDLTGRNLSAYSEMERESMLDLGDEQVISSIVLSRHLRCQQIAGGWVKGNSKYRRVGDDKLRMCRDRFAEYAEQDISHVVVGCRFIPELRDVYQAAKAAGYVPILFHGGVERNERPRRIARFQSADRAVFIAQLSTGAEGIDLSRSSTMLFYSLSESYVTHDQFSRRIERYDDDRVLMYDYLIARGTRDEVTYMSLQMKKDVADFIVENPSLVERITDRTRLDTMKPPT